MSDVKTLRRVPLPSQRITAADSEIDSARAALHRMCPGPTQRRGVLAQLLRSIDAADRLAPESWAVTQFPGGFRLNVGPVEAYACINGRILLLLACDAGALHTRGVAPIRYQSIPESQAVFTGTPEEFLHVREELWNAHVRYIGLAAVTCDGRPRRCKYARFHSSAVVECARRETAGAIPTDTNASDRVVRTELSAGIADASHVAKRVPCGESAAVEDRTLPDARRFRGNPYNGYSWQERMAKYEEMRRRLATGQLAQPRGKCRLCGDPGDESAGVGLEYHDEDYSKEYSWDEPAAFVVCHSCHQRLHMRFARPDAWRSFLAHVRRGGYARDLQQPDVRAEVDAYRRCLRMGGARVELRPMRPYHPIEGEEWFSSLSLAWSEMDASTRRPATGAPPAGP